MGGGFGIGSGELALIAFILLAFGYGLILPLVGMALARRRMKAHLSSRVGVIWPIINIALFAIGVVHGIAIGASPVAPAVGAILNAIWLKLSLTANRVAQTA